MTVEAGSTNSPQVDLTALAERKYGSKHYLFMILDYNNLTLPESFEGGEQIFLPPRGDTRRFAAAELRRQQSTWSPV